MSDPGSGSDSDSDSNITPTEEQNVPRVSNIDDIARIATEAVAKMIRHTINSEDVADYTDTVPKTVKRKKKQPTPIAPVPKSLPPVGAEELPFSEKKNVDEGLEDPDARPALSKTEKRLIAFTIEAADNLPESETDPRLQQDLDDLRRSSAGQERKKMRRKRSLLEVSEPHRLLNEIKNSIRLESDGGEDLEIGIVTSKMPYEFKKKAIKIMMKAGFDQSRGGSTSSDFQRAVKFATDLLSIPWERYAPIPVSLNDPAPKLKAYIGSQIQQLNRNVYGMKRVKQELLEYLVARIADPHGQGDVIGLAGEPGVGKTMIAKFIADFLSTKLYTINLGGQKDSHILKGHGRLYVDSTFGEVSHALIETGVMNPCIRIDEPDKISETYSKDILGVLTHALDPETNCAWIDDYFSGFPLDLRRVTWIVSYNDVETINKDLPVGSRIKIIHVPSYTLNDKVRICVDFILPKLLRDAGFSKNDVSVPDDTAHHIITKYSEKEHGVRSAKRAFQSLVRKIQLLKIIGAVEGTINDDDVELNETIASITQFDRNLKIAFPLTVSPEMVDKIFVNYSNPVDAELASVLLTMYS